MRENFNFLGTAIGSLPNTNPKEAIDLIFETIPNAPLCPQLAKVSPDEDMLFQYTEHFPGIEKEASTHIRYANINSDKYFTDLEELFVDFEEVFESDTLNDEILNKYAISENYCSAFPYFIEKLAATQPEYVKGQIIGPFTFGTSILDTESKCTFYDETYREVISKTLALKALWQVNEYKKVAPKAQPIMFLDEPSMSQLGTSAFITVSQEKVQLCINQIADALHKHGVIVGMHCCGKADWQTILDTQIDLINFDAFSFAQNFSLYAKSLDKFLDKGGMIAWGVVPTLDNTILSNITTDELVQVFENAKNLLVEKGLSEEKILKSSIITPSCGAGSLPQNLATKSMKCVKLVSENLQNKYYGAVK